MNLRKKNVQDSNSKFLLVIKVILFEIFEFRLFNDIWSTFMGIIVFFSMYNYSKIDFGDILPSSLSLAFGLFTVIALIMIFYFTKKNTHNVFIEDDHFESSFDTKL